MGWGVGWSGMQWGMGGEQDGVGGSERGERRHCCLKLCRLTSFSGVGGCSATGGGENWEGGAALKRSTKNKGTISSQDNFT